MRIYGAFSVGARQSPRSVLLSSNLLGESLLCQSATRGSTAVAKTLSGEVCAKNCKFVGTALAKKYQCRNPSRAVLRASFASWRLRDRYGSSSDQSAN